MISNLGMASKISTYTSLNAVQRGTPLADIGLAVIPDWLKPSVAIVVNTFASLIYRSGNQDVLTMAASLSTSYMNNFNANTPNHPSVKYFSYGSKITIPDLIQHPLMGIPSPICWAGGVFNGQGGENDGVVPFSSQRWGTWRGEPSYPITTTGIDHLQATNSANSGQFWYDVKGYFLRMALNARNSQ